jgi:ABC-type uncharacterized transport system auxiliary subunit
MDTKYNLYKFTLDKVFVVVVATKVVLLSGCGPSSAPALFFRLEAAVVVRSSSRGI